MAREALEGTQRSSYVRRVTKELLREGARLGFETGELVAIVERGISTHGWNDRVSVNLSSNAWGVDCSLIVRLVESSDSYLGFGALCELGWSSTSRSVSQAFHALSRYQRACEFATIIEGVVR